MGDARHRRERQAFYSSRGVQAHRASAPARLHVASRLARGGDRESRALRSGRKGRCHDSPLDAFRPDERGRTRTSGLATDSDLAAGIRGGPSPGSRECITLQRNTTGGQAENVLAFARRFAQRGAAGKSYSFRLIPASLINFAHWGISDLMIVANSDGVLATISMPRSCKCLRASFCARTRAVSL